MSGLFAPILESGMFKVASGVIGVVFLVITCALVYWLYRDAIKRSAGAIIWGAIGLVCTFVGIIAGLPFVKYGLSLIGLLPFFTVISLVIIYMIIRPAEFTADAQERDLSLRLLDAELENKSCPKCGAGIASDYLICPDCLSELRIKCDYCGRPIKPNWHACPYCQSKRSGRSGRLSSVGTGSFADVDFDF
ncbi:MAG: zinc ribbon domain-containing protein [Coriobacteriia bacterium]|nr:zinc ribbon domain-containing protein [Coriobacteriia bacterium]